MTVEILAGDCRETLKTVAAGSVHCVVTSPPYWGLRAYVDDAREIGREETPEQHLGNLVDVFSEVKRVLRDDGVCWVNYGDGYNANTGKGFNAQVRMDDANRNTRMPMPTGYKPKDLLSMPFRVVEALRNDGWYHRSTIVWSKKSPMPESVRGSRWERCRVKTAKYDRATDRYGQDGVSDSDLINQGGATWQPCPGCSKCEANDGYVYRMNAGRPTTSHEYVFLLTKSASYFYNQDGNRVPAIHAGRVVKYDSTQQNCEIQDDEHFRTRISQTTTVAAGRNLWTVWNDISQSNYKGAHFATMPIDLATRCVKLGTSEYGCCPACGNQMAPVVDTTREATRPANDNKRTGVDAGNTDPERHETKTNITEWRATCDCNATSEGRPVVLDPFHGSGTTGEAARECGCDYIGCELSDDYIKMGNKRFAQATFL